MANRDRKAFALCQDELRALAERGVVRSFPKHAILLSEGDATDSLFIVVSGRVKVFLSDDDGKEIVLGTEGPGNFFGEMALDGRPRSASVMTLEPSRFVVIPQAQVREFIRDHPSFAVHLIERLIDRVRSLTENLKSLALLDVYGRVARLLLDLAREEGGVLVVGERLTHQEIANRVGASREMISKIFKSLVTGGYISVDKRRIVINRKPPKHW